MALHKIWNLRADSTWIGLVKIQASEAGRSSPGAFIRDLVWLLSCDPDQRRRVIQALQGVSYDQPG